MLAALDSIFGAFKAYIAGTFEPRVFFSGLITNITLEGSLTFFGDKLGVDLSIAAIVAFGVRIFNNLGAIRRHYLLRRAPDFAPWANTCMSGVAGR
ncbi:MAG TPA: small basic family protein [Candidatus Dormibacteraeota bacterium]|nr:small basic family protein [Candidatus Dormibacteraeota bacterium]